MFSFRERSARVASVGAILLFALVPAAPAQQYTVSTVAGGGAPVTPAPALATSVGPTRRVAVDSAGNFYFSASNSVYKVDSSGTLTLVAGDSRADYTGDGGPAINASLNMPYGVTVDSSGNVYIADTGNHAIRMVSGGVISTIAGNGSPGYAGDGGQGRNAVLNNPKGVFFSSGVLYIADTTNNAIRTIDSDGVISTICGNGFPAYLGDGAAAAAGQVDRPEDVTVDSAGTIYIADSGNGVIRDITKSDGFIHTIAGHGTNSPGDGGNATDALLVAPTAVVVDPTGNFYIAEPQSARVRQVTSKGIISTYAGTTGSEGFAGDGGPANKALLWLPTGLCLDSGGNLYIADQLNNRIRKVTSGNISTVAGSGAFNLSTGSGLTAQLSRPSGVVASAGNLYISDYGHNRVLEIAADGSASTVVGTGTAGFSGDGGPGAAAQLYAPAGLAIDQAGNLYIADILNQRVRELSAGGAVSTFAGTGSAGLGGDGGAAAQATLYFPHAELADAAGNVYISDYENSCVRKVSVNGTITTVAGNGTEGYSGDGGPAVRAQLTAPEGLALDARGNLYIADTGNNAVRIVTPDGIIGTIAGNGIPGHDGDGGPAAQSLLAAPTSVAFDASGNFYIADSGTRIRRITTDGIIITVAGTGVPGYEGDGGPALHAQFDGIRAIAVDPAGRMFLADEWNNVVRVLTPVIPPK